MVYSIDIQGIASARPGGVCYSADIDKEQQWHKGTCERITGLSKRYFLAEHESGDTLTLQVVEAALADAKLTIDDIDCIINASATPRQALPFNAAATHKLLKPKRPIPSFDINMTCLGALRALDIAARLFDSYPTILIVTCDIASAALNWADIRSAGIFSDGASAVVVRRAAYDGQWHAAFETHSEGYEYCAIRGGGYALNPHQYPGDYRQVSYFEMDGKQLYRLAMKALPHFIESELAKINIKLSDIDWIVPHQASRSAMSHMAKVLAVRPEKLIDIFQTHGNQVASSLPSALDTLLKSGQCQAGDKILLLGTSAGVGLGMAVWEVPA